MNERTSITTSSTGGESRKLVAFDAVRGGAALGVVLLHACVPYMQPPVPGLAWSVRDVPHWAAATCFWTIELFIMPLFLFMAGFLAWQTLQRRRASQLMSSRARRLLLPLLFGIVVILPLDLYAWLLGWVAEGTITMNKLRSLKFEHGVDRDLWGLSHLWFLQYLFTYVVVLAAGCWLWKRLPRRLTAQFKPGIWLGLLFVVAAATLSRHPEVVWGFQHQFLPVPSKWIYSGVGFGLGVWWAVQDEQLTWLKCHSMRLVMPACLLTVASILIGNWHLDGGSSELASVTLAVLTCLSAATITLAILGVCALRIKRVPVSLQYLAASSFWIYLVHHPLLGLIHLDLKWLMPGTNSMLKVAMAFGLSTILSLATYEVLVRRTRLGRFLGFDWQLPAEAVGSGAIDCQSTIPLHSPGREHPGPRRASAPGVARRPRRAA